MGSFQTAVFRWTFSDINAELGHRFTYVKISPAQQSFVMIFGFIRCFSLRKLFPLLWYLQNSSIFLFFFGLPSARQSQKHQKWLPEASGIYFVSFEISLAFLIVFHLWRKWVVSRVQYPDERSVTCTSQNRFETCIPEYLPSKKSALSEKFVHVRNMWLLKNLVRGWLWVVITTGQKFV